MQFFPRHFARQTAFVLRRPLSRPTKASFSMSSRSSSDSKSTGSATPVKEPLALPETAHDSSTKLDMSNGDTTIKLDHLGPMVVNVDGTLSRISNWERMADIEKKNTLRIIGKRNQVRLEALRAKEAEEKGRD